MGGGTVSRRVRRLRGAPQPSTCALDCSFFEALRWVDPLASTRTRSETFHAPRRHRRARRSTVNAPPRARAPDPRAPNQPQGQPGQEHYLGGDTPSSEDDSEEDGKVMRKRYDEARGAIERALRGEGDSKKVAAKCRACPGTLLLNTGDLRAHAKSKKHAKNLKRLGKADDDTFVCFYPAVKEDEGIVSDGEAETHAERLARLRAQKILRAAEGERTEGGKFSLDQFDSSDDEDSDGDSDDADDDARDAKMTKRLAKKEFLRKVKESAVSNDEGSKEKRSRRHAQRKRKGKSKPGKRQRMLMRAASNDA